MHDLEARAADFDSMREELEAVKAAMECTRRELEASKSDCEGLRDKVSKLDKENKSLTAALCSSRKEKEKLSHELGEKADIEAMVREVDEKLKGVGDMRTHYENRISRLREEIVRLKSVSGAWDADELKEIDMLAQPAHRVPVDRSGEPERKEERKAKDDTDWLQFL